MRSPVLPRGLAMFCGLRAVSHSLRPNVDGPCQVTSSDVEAEIRTTLSVLYLWGRRWPTRVFDLAHQVCRGAGLLVACEDAEHRVADQALGADEGAPRLVWVVEPPVVGLDSGCAVNEKRRVQLWPFREGVLPVLQRL